MAHDSSVANFTQLVILCIAGNIGIQERNVADFNLAVAQVDQQTTKFNSHQIFRLYNNKVVLK